ncbi:DsbA-like protein [Ostertagia ostertagi]
MARTLEFYFDYGSPYSYLADTQVEGIAQRAGATLVRKPMLLGGVFKATGNHSPAELPQKSRWSGFDMPLWARHYGVPFQRNPFFPVNTLALMRGAAAAQIDGTFERYHPAVYKAMWVDGTKPERHEGDRRRAVVRRPRSGEGRRAHPGSGRERPAQGHDRRGRRTRRVRRADLLRGQHDQPELLALAHESPEFDNNGAHGSVLSESELVAHGLRRRPRRAALDPVGLGAGIELLPQEVLAERAHDQADRHDGDEEQQAEDQRVHHLVEKKAELQPEPVQRAERFRIDERHDQKGRRNRQHPLPGRALLSSVAPQVDRAQDSEETRENEPEAAIGARLDVLLTRIILMKLAGRHCPKRSLVDLGPLTL